MTSNGSGTGAPAGKVASRPWSSPPASATRRSGPSAAADEVDVDPARLRDAAGVAREPVGDVEHRGRPGERRHDAGRHGRRGRELGADEPRMPRPHVGRPCGIGFARGIRRLVEEQREPPGRVTASAGVRHDVARRAHRSAARAPGPRGRRTR